MGDVESSRVADIALDHHLPDGCQDETEVKKALDNWTNSITKVQYNPHSTYWQTQQIQPSSQQQVPRLTRSTHRTRNYYGGQLEGDQGSTNFNVSGAAGSQQAPS
ncbi:unnamed protein product [Schistosoma bovis]|nr:unnamed protein product [Schistosoma bovis]